MIPANRKISWSSVLTPIYLVISVVVVAVIYENRRSFGGFFQGFKGGTEIGLGLAYSGSLLLLSAQFYTIVKRSNWIGFMKKVGGVRPWLSIHIGLSFVGLLAVLAHAGLPYRFNSYDLLDHGLAGLTTYLLVASALSGVFGRYVYKRLPAMKKVFSYWKPSHLFVTGLLFAAAIIHMLTAFGG